MRFNYPDTNTFIIAINGNSIRFVPVAFQTNNLFPCFSYVMFCPFFRKPGLSNSFLF